MTLALFLFAVLLAFGIARYNKSNKLFWILIVSFMLGIAGTKVLYDTFHKEQSEKSLNQAYPTQGLAHTGKAIVCFFDTVGETTSVKATSNPVGQVNTPDYIEPLITLSNVSGATQGIYLHAMPNPPNEVPFVSDS